jgi:hypothetical protein
MKGHSQFLVAVTPETVTVLSDVSRPSSNYCSKHECIYKPGEIGGNCVDATNSHAESLHTFKVWVLMSVKMPAFNVKDGKYYSV